MLPLIGSTGKPKKAGSGAALAWMDGRIFALKGGNTDEVFVYDGDFDSWSFLSWLQYPLGNGRKVGPGGALTYAPHAGLLPMGALFSTKGNNTTEFYMGFQLPNASAMCLDRNTEANKTAPIAVHLSITPNPFNGSTRIDYSVPTAGRVSIRLYDATGRLVRTVNEGFCNAGHTSAVDLNASHLAHGIYLLKFNSKGCGSTRKLVIE
jgi:hypothetical protein